MDKIGFVGLGIMGKPMAKNLLKAGFDLTFYARRPEVIKEAEEAGGKAVGSSKAVAEATDIIVTCVTADPEVREVILGENGVLEGASEGDLIVDMSTISPLTIREIAEAVALKGVHVMDAPISGGETGAIAGTLTIMAGGDKADFERCQGIFKAMGKEENLFNVGPIGVGQTVKIVNQYMAAINISAIVEAFTIGIQAGADPEVMHDVISVSTANSFALQQRGKDFILKDFFEPGFMLDLMKKDVGIGVDLAKALNVPAPLGGPAYQLFAIASRLGAGKLDFSAVCKAMEHMSGIKIGKAG